MSRSITPDRCGCSKLLKVVKVQNQKNRRESLKKGAGSGIQHHIMDLLKPFGEEMSVQRVYIYIYIYFLSNTFDLDSLNTILPAFSHSRLPTHFSFTSYLHSTYFLNSEHRNEVYIVQGNQDTFKVSQSHFDSSKLIQSS